MLRQQAVFRQGGLGSSVYAGMLRQQCLGRDA